MKISVVTVCYNAADTIEKTMLSVLNQTYHDIEYIIIDGGSTDGTVEIIRKYADRIAYWVSEPDKGIYDAMNKGIKVATGEYIYFLGADDLLCENVFFYIAPLLTRTHTIYYGNVFITYAIKLYCIIVVFMMNDYMMWTIDYLRIMFLIFNRGEISVLNLCIYLLL